MTITKGTDPFAFVKHEDMRVAPATHGDAVTPSDTVELSKYGRGLYVGVGGNVSVTLVSDPEPALAGTVWKNVPAGTLLPIRCRQVWATNTTATDLVNAY